jgi:hypothetical protein
MKGNWKKDNDRRPLENENRQTQVCGSICKTKIE